MALTSPPVLGQSYFLSAWDWTTGLGYHYPLSQFRRTDTYTIMIKDNVVDVQQLPLDELFKEQDAVYRGGSDYTVDYNTALLIYNAGYGRWLTEL
jgi:hypothetical protein